MTELYRKYRPTKFSDVVGQTETVVALQKAIKEQSVPHAICFSGNSGCGKTTIARILLRYLNCVGKDFVEINAASARGIDTIREIESSAEYPALFGSTRVWLLDECHALTKDAMTSLLKIVEDPEDYSYFMFCTTHLDKVITTLKNRCTHYRINALSFNDILRVLNRVVSAEGLSVSEKILKRIAEYCDGSPRRAINQLEKACKFASEKEQLDSIRREDGKQTIDLCRALMDEHADWQDIQKILNGIVTDPNETPENIRHAVLGYATSVLLNLKGGKDNGRGHRASFIAEVFSENWYESGKAGLVRSCWEVMSTK